MLAELSLDSSGGSAPLQHTLSLDSIDTLAIRARIRLFRKANSLATPLKALIAPRNIFFSRRLVWSRGSARLHRRFVGLTWFPDDWAARELLPRLHERRMLVSPARATASYRDHQFAATAGFFRSPMFDASLSNGVRYLIAARCNAIWSTSRAVAARLLRNGHPFVGRQCPICRTPLGAFSPVGHLITACTDPRIQAYRDTIGFSREFFVLLWQHAHEVAGLLPAPDVNSLDLSILVLGGTLCGGATLGNDWLAGFSQMGTVVAPPAGRVVHFLQRTMWSYSSSLWAYHRNAAGHHTPVTHEVAGLLPAPDVNSLDLSILVLGGTLCGGATLGNDWLAGFSQMGTVVAPPAGRVVHFLQRTMWSHSSSLWAYHRNAAGYEPSGPTLPTLLGSSNWTQFSTAVELAAEILEVPNLHTTGTVPQGKAVAAARLRLAITNSIGEELLKQVPIETCKTAKDLFDALQTLCKTSEQQQRDVAMRTFTTPYADLAEPVEVYVARLVAVAGKFLVADEYVRAAFVLEMLSKGVALTQRTPHVRAQ
ncbi:hypothetical protein HK105_201088 [Polyrhizophydium stewartii]|uniref:Reverse transcriptase zinc-binding domain-containing protein n=1 Tax=Polyrhizophydium stewartii TaxID=2732419 RepID=A0ABR4NIU2_9FUNG